MAGRTQGGLVFDPLGRPVKAIGPDAGETLVLLDIAGQPVSIWKTGALRLDQAYDTLRRPTTRTATIGSDPATIREIIEYGEGVTSAALSNLRSKPFQQWDTAGRVTLSSYDFKGNLLASTRRFWDRTGGDTVTWASTPDSRLRQQLLQPRLTLPTLRGLH